MLAYRRLLVVLLVLKDEEEDTGVVSSFPFGLLLAGFRRGEYFLLCFLFALKKLDARLELEDDADLDCFNLALWSGGFCLLLAGPSKAGGGSKGGGRILLVLLGSCSKVFWPFLFMPSMADDDDDDDDCLEGLERAERATFLLLG
jgi:hypothetical protein